MHDQVVCETLRGPEEPHCQCAHDGDDHARRQAPPAPDARSSALGRRDACSGRRCFQCPPQVRFQRNHLALELMTGRAALQVLGKFRRCDVRLGAYEQARVLAIHGPSPVAGRSAVGVNP